MADFMLVGRETVRVGCPPSDTWRVTKTPRGRLVINAKKRRVKTKLDRSFTNAALAASAVRSNSHQQ